MWSNCWHVKLGEGGRRMTDSQIGAAAARCWIDAETPVRRPRSSEWTKLGDAAPAPRIVDEPADEKDIDTSAMILLSGEFEIVDDERAPSKEELAAARPPRIAPKLFVVALAMLAGGGLLARGHVPKLDAELDAIVTAMRPAPLPTPAATPPAMTAAAPAAITVTSSASLAVVPKMRAPVPKMREPATMKPESKPVVSAKAKAKSRTRRH
jgi:hypothetical protein